MLELAEPRIPKNVKNGDILSHGDDSTILATFDDAYVKNEYQSEQQGRVILDHFYQIDLKYPGNNLSDFSYRFRPEEATSNNHWIQRFPRQWEAFKAQNTQAPDGMPIDAWAPLDKRRILELKAMHIYTVEQVAAQTDMTGPNMGLDWRKLVEMAKATLKPADGAAEISRLNQVVEELKNRLDSRDNLALMTPKKEDLTPVTLEETPKRRGRPPRQETTQVA